MIKSISKKQGRTWELLYRGEADLLEESDTIIFTIKDPRIKNTLECEFTFDNEGPELTANGVFNNLGETLQLKMDLHNWKSHNYMESKEAFYFQIGGGPTLAIKYGTISPKDRNARSFTLNIWIEWK